MNNSFLIPTKNKESFYDPKSVLELLEKEFPLFSFNSNIGINTEEVNFYIEVRNKNVFITNLYLYRDSSHLVNTSDVEELDNIGKIDLGDKLIEFFDTHPDLENTILLTYGRSDIDRMKIEKWFRNYFGCFLFDEGIHPEFIPSDYIPTQKRGLIKRFKQFIGRKLMDMTTK